MIGTGSGQLTAGAVGFVAHPAKLRAEIIGRSKCAVTSLPSGHDGLGVLGFTSTIPLLQCERTARVVLSERSDVLAVECCGVLIPGNKKGGTCD